MRIIRLMYAYSEKAYSYTNINCYIIKTSAFGDKGYSWVAKEYIFEYGLCGRIVTYINTKKKY